MSVLSAIFYGLIQGLTEFLPVSSSGHLAIARRFFGMSDVESDYFTFSILLHLATLIAVFIVYWRDIFPLIPAFFRMVGKALKGKFKLSEADDREKLTLYIIIATLPLVLAMFINDYVEKLTAYTKIVGVILIFNGVMLYLSDRISKGEKDISEVKPKNALEVGLCQLLAVLPGLSRSGSTITGGRLCGFSRELAVKFSFILSIPAILGANILEVPEMLENPIAKADVPVYLCGMAVAALTGVAAMKLIQYISRKSNFKLFSYYCIIVGILTVIFA